MFIWILLILILEYFLQQGIESEPLFPIMQQSSPSAPRSHPINEEFTDEPPKEADEEHASPSSDEEQPGTSGQGATKEQKVEEEEKKEGEEGNKLVYGLQIYHTK